MDTYYNRHFMGSGGKSEMAAELLGLALTHPAKSVMTKREAGPILEMLRDTLPADQLEAALERGKQLDLEQMVAQILEEQS